MTRDALKRLYFDWLYDQVVREPRDSPDGYVYVCNLMDQVIFDWSVPNDDNRAADGRELRRNFVRENRLRENLYQDWFAEDATLFEVIVALCWRADFNTDLSPPWWFKTFLDNLGLSRYTNFHFKPQDTFAIERTLHKLNNRHYSMNGRGGLFPLRYTTNDQRGVELWYQMAEYQTENRMF